MTTNSRKVDASIHAVPPARGTGFISGSVGTDPETRFEESNIELAEDERLPPKSMQHTVEDESVVSKTCIDVTNSADGAPVFFSSTEAQTFRSRWNDVQVGFVDDPANSVEQANLLVSDAIEHLTQGFSAKRRERDQSTEELRLLLRRYRSLFERLLSI